MRGQQYHYLTFLLLSILSLSSAGVTTGTVSWSKNGQSVTSHLAQTGGSNGAVTASGSSIQFGQSRFYFTSSASDSFSQNIFEKLYLLGSTFSFTVDLSGIGCGCNVALYTVSMPGGGQSTCGDYYCDANNVCGQRCTEMDIMEANSRAFQVTPHQSTDGNGCARKFQSRSDSGNYGWGSQYTINTQRSFAVSMTFHTSGGSLSSIDTTLSQGGKVVTITHDSACGGNYLSSLTDSLKNGMVLVFSSWGDSGQMGWLDSPPCSSGATCTKATATISNIALSGSSSGGGNPPPPPPPTSSPPPPPSSGCVDKPIPGSDTTCAQQAGWGKCGESYIQGYCDVSCGRCCGDVSPPGDVHTCAEQAGWGNCGQSWMNGYCKKSCNRCGVTSLTADTNAQSTTETGSSSTALIVALSVACVVIVVLLVVIVIMRKKKIVETV